MAADPRRRSGGILVVRARCRLGATSPTPAWDAPAPWDARAPTARNQRTAGRAARGVRPRRADGSERDRHRLARRRRVLRVAAGSGARRRAARAARRGAGRRSTTTATRTAGASADAASASAPSAHLPRPAGTSTASRRAAFSSTIATSVPSTSSRGASAGASSIGSTSNATASTSRAIQSRCACSAASTRPEREDLHLDPVGDLEAGGLAQVVEQADEVAGDALGAQLVVDGGVDGDRVPALLRQRELGVRLGAHLDVVGPQVHGGAVGERRGRSRRRSSSACFTAPPSAVEQGVLHQGHLTARLAAPAP